MVKQFYSHDTPLRADASAMDDEEKIALIRGHFTGSTVTTGYSGRFLNSSVREEFSGLGVFSYW